MEGWRRGLAPTFQVADRARPRSLDSAPERRGYVIDAPVSIQVSPARSLSSRASGSRAERASRRRWRWALAMHRLAAIAVSRVDRRADLPLELLAIHRLHTIRSRHTRAGEPFRSGGREQQTMRSAEFGLRIRLRPPPCSTPAPNPRALPVETDQGPLAPRRSRALRLRGSILAAAEERAGSGPSALGRTSMHTSRGPNGNAVPPRSFGCSRIPGACWRGRSTSSRPSPPSRASRSGGSRRSASSTP